MRRRIHRSQVFTPLNVHLAGVLLLLVLDLVLGTKLLVAWHGSHSDQTAEYAANLHTYQLLQAQASRFQQLPAQLQTSRTQAGSFAAARIPTTESAVLAELGALCGRDHVRLSRAAYPAAPVLPGLVEMRIDANVTGGYQPIMHFINDLERDKNHAFFLIRSITLSGQQGGEVNLRVRMTTYLRTDAANAAALQTSSAQPNAGEVQ